MENFPEQGSRTQKQSRFQKLSICGETHYSQIQNPKARTHAPSRHPLNIEQPSGAILESILSTSAQRDGIPTLDDLIADMYVISLLNFVKHARLIPNRVTPSNLQFLTF